MAAAILCQDVLALCLLVSHGDLNTSLADILAKLEEFQEQHNRHFGVDMGDVRAFFL